MAMKSGRGGLGAGGWGEEEGEGDGLRHQRRSEEVKMGFQIEVWM